MSAPILQKGDWVFFQFPAKTNRYGEMDDAANMRVVDEFTKGMNAHGVNVQGWICSSAVTGLEIIAVFRQPPPVVTVRDVIPNG